MHAFHRQRGFTLLELIIVLALTGILAVAALARFADTADFDRRGFYDETLSALRYAQKAAIAQRRKVCVSFTSTTITLRVASGAGNAAACDLHLASPAGAESFVVHARGAAAFASTPDDFWFNALGQASGGRSINFAGFPLTITVEQETGYVHS